MKKYILFYLLCILSLSASAKEKVRITSQKYFYIIDTINNSFQKKTLINGYHQQEKFIYSYYFGELDQIIEATAYVSDRNRRSKLPRQNHFQSRVLSNNFYAGISSYNLQFDHKNFTRNPQHFSIELEQKSEQIIRLASLNFIKSKDEKIDTIVQELIVPNQYIFIFSHEDASKIKDLEIDSIQYNSYKTYRFQKVFSENEAIDSNYYHGIRSIVRMSNTSAYKFLNTWYVDMIRNIQLSENYKTICDSITKKSNDSLLILKSIYDYVKTSIRYIDIENGINAFRPRSCDEVLFNKYGDCKDMAFLIQKMLEYKGIRAYLALSSTSSHEYQFNFPSIASANHLICVAVVDGKNYYLDATEKYGLYSIPSRQIINTSAFIIDDQNFRIIQIPKSDAHKSKEIRKYDMSVNATGINGTAKIICTGYSMIELESIISYSAKSQLNKTLEKYCNQSGYNTQYRNFKIERSDTSIQLLCDVIIKETVLSQVENKSYLDLTFLPNPMPYISSTDTTARTIDLDFNHTYEIDFTLSLEKPIENINSPFKFFKLNSDDLKYQFQINKQNNSLNIHYTLSTHKEKYEKNEFEKFKTNSIKIATTLNHEISIY